MDLGILGGIDSLSCSTAYYDHLMPAILPDDKAKNGEDLGAFQYSDWGRREEARIMGVLVRNEIHQQPVHNSKDKDHEIEMHIPNAIHLGRGEITAVVGGVRGMLAPVDEIERVLSNKGITNQSKIIIYDNTTGKDRQ
jgi:hypothetical protein